MTIGNIKLATRTRPSQFAMVLLALLPIPPPTIHGTGREMDRFKALKIEVHHHVLDKILNPLREAYDNGIRIRCADMKYRKCFPILAAWPADHMEYVKLFNVTQKLCPVCTIPHDSIGRRDDQIHSSRNYHNYEAAYNTLVDTENATPGERTAAKSQLIKEGIKLSFNVFWSLPGVQVEALHVPDLLHGMYLGLLDYLMRWLDGFLADCERSSVFDNIWRTLPRYPGFAPPTKSFREVSSWQGKELRQFGRVVLSALAAALSTPNDHSSMIGKVKRETVTQALSCVRNLTDFQLMAEYPSHTETTIGYMKGYLKGYHDGKAAFKKYKATKRDKRDMTDAVRSLQQDHERAAPTPGNETNAAKAKRLEENHKELAAKKNELAGSFNFIKMHLPTHYEDHVRRFGSIPAFSTEAGESAHRRQVKDGYRTSNHQPGTFYKQIISYYTRVSAMGIRQLNVKQLVREGYYKEETADVLDLMTDSGKIH